MLRVISVLWLSCLHAAVLGWTSMPRPVLVISCVQWRPPAARGTIVCRSLASDTPPPKQRFHVAPMQAYTNRHLRKLCRLLSKEAVLWTEMEKADDLLTSEAAADRRLRHDPTDHCVLQLGGRDIPSLQAACALANHYGFDEVNLNCGCPSIQTGGADDYGATLMLDPAGTGDLLRILCDASRAPVSVKCRLGTHERVRDDGTLPDDNYDTLAHFVRTVSSRAPVKHFAVHCRSAVLSGLSPTKNRCVPPLRPDFVLRLAEEFPDLAFTLNGGMAGAEHVARTLQAHPVLDGVMAGRWVLQNPLDLAGMDAVLVGGASGQREWSNDVVLATALGAINTYSAYALRAADTKDAALHELAIPFVLVLEHLRAIDAALWGDDGDTQHIAAREGRCGAGGATGPVDNHGSIHGVGVMWYEGDWLDEAHLALTRGISDLLDLRGGRSSLSRDGLSKGSLSWRQTTKMLEKACGKKVTSKITRNVAEDIVASSAVPKAAIMS